MTTERPPWTSERAALAALTFAVVVYGAQSATDWTWFVPGLTAIALVAAGFVAGRGPLAHDAARGGESRGPSRQRPTPARLAVCAAVALIALACGWAIWQPVAADRALARSYDLAADGEPVAALREAADARDLNPHSVEPFYAAATALLAIDHQRQAIASLRRAAAERPRDPEPWLQIATLQLNQLSAPAAGFAAAEQALRRDPHSAQAVSLYEHAKKLLAEQRAAAAPAPATTTP
jgi:hypothetical protein